MFETVHEDWRFLLDLSLPIEKLQRPLRTAENYMPEDKILAIALLSQAKDHTIRAIAECLSHTCNSTREWKEDFVHEKAYETIRDAVLDLAAIAARCAVQEGWRSIPEHLHTLSEEMLTELELDDEENGQEGCSERLYEEVVNEFKLRLP